MWHGNVPPAILVFGIAALSGAGTAFAADVAPTAAQSATARAIAQLIENEHYRSRPWDAALSGEMLDRFLAAMDPHADILSREDIASLDAHRADLARDFRAGDLDHAFDVYTTFRAAFEERMRAVREALSGEWTFTSDAAYPPRGPDAPRASLAELDGLWRARLEDELLTLVLAGRELPDAVAVLRKRYEELGARVSALSSDEVFREWVNACTRSLDPHSEYFLPRRSQSAAATGPVEGIGIQLETDREFVAVRRIFDGGAADRSGLLHPGDRIIAVGPADGPFVDVVGWTLDPVVALIRGPAGSAVRLQVLPRGTPSQAPPAVLSFVRDRVALAEQAPRKRCREIDGLRLCTIAVPRFYIDYAGVGRGGAGYAGTGADLLRLLNEDREAPADGLVLDMRGNTGGALLEAARLAGLFVDAGPIVQVKHAGGGIEEFPDPIPGTVYDGALVVLLDRHSASATEIFAAAIQDYRRGSIVGERSYGKGTVQETFDLNQGETPVPTSGQLVLTTAEYFRVTGGSTQVEGVALDVELPAWPRASDYGERFEPNPLVPGRTAPLAFKPFRGAALVDDAVRARSAARMRDDPVVRAVQAARRSPPPALYSRNALRRREALEGMAAEDRALAAALRGDRASGQDGRDRDGVPAETLWRDLVLAEAERVLADVVRASRTTATEGEAE
jgi:carboxyl-terminal processing protease